MRIPSYRCSGRVYKQSQLSQQLYLFYIALCTCAMLCTYIYIGKQCTGTLRARMCALPLLHTYIYIIDLCRSESYSGTHVYIYIQYISKMKKTSCATLIIPAVVVFCTQQCV